MKKVGIESDNEVGRHTNNTYHSIKKTILAPTAELMDSKIRTN